MAGTVTSDYYTIEPLRKVHISWTANASGAATGTTVAVNGLITRAIIKHGASSSAPSASYTIQLTDVDGQDVLRRASSGVVASVSNAIDYCPTIVDQSSAAVGPVAVDGKLSLAVASAGNANTGELIVYLT